MSSDNNTVTPGFTYSGNMNWWAHAGFFWPREAINNDLPDIEIYDIVWEPGAIVVVEMVVVGRHASGDVITEIVRHFVPTGDTLTLNPDSTGPLDRYIVIEND